MVNTPLQTKPPLVTTGSILQTFNRQTPWPEIEIAAINVKPTASKKGRKEEIAGLVVLLSHHMLTEAASAGVMDGTTSQPGIARVIAPVGAWLTFGDMGNVPDWLPLAYTP